MSFDTLGLLPQLIDTLQKKGYKQPTSIQQQVIPLILEGNDILGGAQTGTGKTASFTLPILQRLYQGKSNAIRALILAPTRELAAQLDQSVKNYGQKLSLSSTVVFGGIPIKKQMFKLRKGADILIATPGRLLDHVRQRSVDLSKVEILVLDEADHMLDMGFIHDVKTIIELLPQKRQTLMFSATFSPNIRKLAHSVLKNPVTVEVAKSNTLSEGVKQQVYSVDTKRKPELLTHLIRSENWQQALVFMRTKHSANRLTSELEKSGISAVTIHGNKTQGARTQALASFKKGKARILVATDIAARGLDIDQLPHVVNFDLPEAPQDYVHRIGRTGRAGHKGEAISLVSIDEKKQLQEIESLIKLKLPASTIEGFEPDPSIKPAPPRRRGGGGGGQRGRGAPRSGGAPRGGSAPRGGGAPRGRGGPRGTGAPRNQRSRKPARGR